MLRQPLSTRRLALAAPPLRPPSPSHAHPVHRDADATQVLRRLAAIAEHMSNAVLVCDRTGRIEWVNAAFTAMTGYRSEEALGRMPADLLDSALHPTGFREELRRALASTGHWEGEALRRRRNGEVHPAWLCASAVRGADGSITHYIAVYTDLTRIRLADELIHRLAFYDPATGLPNRRLLQDRLNQALASCRRHGTRAAVLCLGLDRLEHFSSAHGHDAGDRLLASMARRLQGCVRGIDTVARSQADGFVVVVTDLSPTAPLAARQAESVAEKLRDAASSPFDSGGARFHGGASIGISLIDGACASPEEVHHQASIALHVARRAGRSTLRFFDPQAQQAVQDGLALEADLRRAIGNGELALHLQPQVRADGRVLGAEALLRWLHPVHGRIAPDRFIPLAEEGGLILELGRWVLHQGCRILRHWAGDVRCASLDLSINVSGREFAQPDFVAQVHAALQSAGAQPQRLMIELTESAVLADADDAARKMADLRRLGVRIALDDFGTGHSSLAYLSRLPLDQLKIDRTFVMRMLGNHNDAILVQTIIRLAEGLGLQVIAEGVESQAHVHSLLAMGCASFQGYHFGKPVPEAQFIAAMAETALPAMTS